MLFLCGIMSFFWVGGIHISIGKCLGTTNLLKVLNFLDEICEQYLAWL